jgi:hypothetical protein
MSVVYMRSQMLPQACRKPKFSKETSEEATHPPLKAPTGFRTGATTASCLNTALVWNPRAAVVLMPARTAVRKSGAAIVCFVLSLLFNRMVFVYVYGCRGYMVGCRVVIVVVCLTCDRRDVSSSLRTAGNQLTWTLACQRSRLCQPMRQARFGGLCWIALRPLVIFGIFEDFAMDVLITGCDHRCEAFGDGGLGLLLKTLVVETDLGGGINDRGRVFNQGGGGDGGY